MRVTTFRIRNKQHRDENEDVNNTRQTAMGQRDRAYEAEGVGKHWPVRKDWVKKKPLNQNTEGIPWWIQSMKQQRQTNRTQKTKTNRKHGRRASRKQQREKQHGEEHQTPDKVNTQTSKQKSEQNNKRKSTTRTRNREEKTKTWNKSWSRRQKTTTAWERMSKTRERQQTRTRKSEETVWGNSFHRYLWRKSAFSLNHQHKRKEVWVNDRTHWPTSQGFCHWACCCRELPDRHSSPPRRARTVSNHSRKKEWRMSTCCNESTEYKKAITEKDKQTTMMSESKHETGRKNQRQRRRRSTTSKNRDEPLVQGLYSCTHSDQQEETWRWQHRAQMEVGCAHEDRSKGHQAVLHHLWLNKER